MGILHKKPYHKLPTQAGLTLIEVLIALSIVGIAITAVIKSTSENIRGTLHLQNKMIASWVALEKINSIRIGLLPMRLSDVHHDKTEMLGQSWYWQATLDETGNEHIKKTTIQVFNNEEYTNPLVTLESYLYEASSFS